MEIISKLKSYIEGPQGIAMGTRDANFVPDFNRVLGAQVMDNEHIKVFIARETADRVIKNIDDNKLVTVVMANPLNYESYQFKGRCTKYAESSEEEQHAVMKYMNTFNDHAAKIGIKDGVIFTWPHKHTFTIVFEVDEVFDQTPKIGTGNKLS